MFKLLRQMFKFWFIIMLVSAGAYLLFFNIERILVKLPGIGEFQVITGVAFLICFALGATVFSLYFAADIMRKTFEIKRQAKRIRLLEQRIAQQGPTTADTKRRSWFGTRDEPSIGPPTTQPELTKRDLL